MSVTGPVVSGLRQGLNGLWLLPGLIAACLALLAIGLVVVDRQSGEDEFWFAYQGGPGAARDVLAVLAGSSITVAALTFSIMIVTLQLVAGQYTPRALRTFLGDRITQIVAGTFVGVFAYSLLVLRTIRGDNGASEFVPSLSISVGIALGLAALVLLIVFIHHMSRSIQISEITARIARETVASLERFYPAEHGEPAGHDAEAVLRGWQALGQPAILRGRRSGFVHTVNLRPLATVADRHDLNVHVLAVPGDFVTRSSPLVKVWPAGAAGTEELPDALTASLVLANERDLREDALFGVRQLADIAVRALSPGINDPATAATCLHHLQDILEQLAALRLPDRVRLVAKTLVVVERRSFEDALEPLAEIAVFASGQPLVDHLVLEVLSSVAEAALRAGLAERQNQVFAVAERIQGPLLEGAATEADRTRLASRMALVSRSAVAWAPSVGPNTEHEP